MRNDAKWFLKHLTTLTQFFKTTLQFVIQSAALNLGVGEAQEDRSTFKFCSKQGAIGKTFSQTEPSITSTNNVPVAFTRYPGTACADQCLWAHAVENVVFTSPGCWLNAFSILLGTGNGWDWRGGRLTPAISDASVWQPARTPSAAKIIENQSGGKFNVPFLVALMHPKETAEVSVL